MAKGNLISKQILAATVEKAVGLIKQLNDLLSPYYQNVAATEKRDFPIVSDERIAFVSRGLEFIATDPKYLPQDTDTTELTRDWDLFNNSRKLLIPCKQISTALTNMNNLAGSDVYVTLLDYYDIVKRKAEKGDARAKVVYEELKSQFTKKKKTENKG